MDYEIQILSKDRTKIIRIPETNDQSKNYNHQLAWEDYYFALGSVIDDKADQFRENNTLIGRLDVRDISFDEVVDVMCEDLTPKMTEFLVEDKEISEYRN